MKLSFTFFVVVCSAFFYQSANCSEEKKSSTTSYTLPKTPQTFEGCLGSADFFAFHAHVQTGKSLYHNIQENIQQITADQTKQSIDSSGTTILMVAAGFGNKKLVEQLMAKKADINQTKGDGKSALNIAVERKHFNLARHLVTQYKAKDLAPTKQGFKQENKKPSVYWKQGVSLGKSADTILTLREEFNLWRFERLFKKPWYSCGSTVEKD